MESRNNETSISVNPRINEIELPSSFFCLTPPPYTQFRDLGVRPAPRGASKASGVKKWYFFERNTEIYSNMLKSFTRVVN